MSYMQPEKPFKRAYVTATPRRTGLDDGPPLPSPQALERAYRRIEEKYSVPPSAPEVLEVLQRYVSAYPAFRIKPIGAPGSEQRNEQESLIVLEDEARELLKRSGRA